MLGFVALLRMDWRKEELVNLVVVVVAILSSTRTNHYPETALFGIRKHVLPAGDIFNEFGMDDEFHVVSAAFSASRDELDLELVTQDTNPLVQCFVNFQVHVYMIVLMVFQNQRDIYGVYIGCRRMGERLVNRGTSADLWWQACD